MAKKKQIYVQFLGFTTTKISPRLKEVEKKYKGKVFKIEKLPKGFKLQGSALGTPFLKYRGNTCFRIYWEKRRGKWYNLTHSEFSTPKEALNEHNKLII